MGEHGAGILKQRTASFRERDTSGLAKKELHIELSLQGPDLLTERRLLHPKPLGRSSNVALLRNGDEVPKVP
jgi:hypothetical protein